MRHELGMRIHRSLAHLESEKVLKEIRDKYYFKNMTKYVKKVSRKLY